MPGITTKDRRVTVPVSFLIIKTREELEKSMVGATEVFTLFRTVDSDTFMPLVAFAVRFESGIGKDIPQAAFYIAEISLCSGLVKV